MMQSYILLGIATVTTVLSQLLFKQGMIVVGSVNFSFANMAALIMNVIKSPYLLIGLFFYGVSFLLWLLVLSKLKISVVYPITSINFVLVLVASYFLFGEKLSIFQYLGILIIITGVLILAKA
jgi:multidrug transporter EmrE-like cation transporter